VKRSLQNIILVKNIIINEDFNSHHSWWNSAVSNLNAKKAVNLVKWLKNFKFDLQSEADNRTFHKDNLTRVSIIDLVFSTKDISQYISWWKDSEYDIDSSHDMIFFFIARESDMLVQNSIYIYQYNFEKANWKNLIRDILAEQDNEEFNWSLTEISVEFLKFEVEKL